MEAWAGGAPFGAEASILKIRGTEILQAIAELALELEGPLGIAYDPEVPPLPPHQKASLMAYEYLYARCWSIFSTRNLIAREVLGI
ncbi:MAG: acyl-CoA dehydrogenase family protein [Panacagrimonas sp.]